jgi:hypothetical protein
MITGAGARSKKLIRDDENAYDIEPSEIDIEMDDESRHLLFEENFKDSEFQVGVCPFQHWSIYR